MIKKGNKLFNNLTTFAHIVYKFLQLELHQDDFQEHEIIMKLFIGTNNLILT